MGFRSCFNGIRFRLSGKDATKYRVLAGVMIFGLPQCFPWCYGNLVTYEYSYFKYHLKEEHNVYDQVVWILPIYLVGLSSAMLTTDLWKKVMSLRCILILSVLLESLGLMLSYFTVQFSVWTLMTTLSCLYGYAQGIKISLSFLYPAIWFDEHVGLATCLAAAPNGVGGILFNVVITAYMNPENHAPDVVDGNLSYFSNVEINARFPNVFLILSGITITTEIAAVLLIEVGQPSNNPPSHGGKSGSISKRSNSMTSVQNIGPNNNGNTNNEERENVLTDGPEGGGHQIGHVAKTTVTDSSAIKPASFLASTSYDAVASLNETNEFSRCNDAVRTTTNMEYDSNTQSFILERDITVSDKNMRPSKVLQSTLFYVIWFAYFATSMALLTVTNSFKLFGQLWIHEDNFLAWIGSVFCIAVCLSRLGIGFVIDRFGVSNTIIVILTLNSICLAYWYFTILVNKWLFLLWTSGLIGVQSTTLSVFPVAILKSFGSTHYVTNTGLLMSAMLTASFVYPVFTSRFVADLGWFWLFQVVGAVSTLSLVAFVINLCLARRSEP